MKKLFALLIAVLCLAGCSSSDSAPVTYEVTCITIATGPFRVELSSDKIEGLSDWSPTYTLTLPSGAKMTADKGSCVLFQAPKKEAEESNEIDASPSAAPSPSN